MGAFETVDGQTIKVVLLGPRTNPKNAVAVRGEGEQVYKEPLNDLLDTLSPRDVVDVICTQERVFGDAGLEPPPFALTQE